MSSASSRWTKPAAPLSSMNSRIASASARPGTPMKVTSSPNCSWTPTTVGASRRQNGHHGAQNHRTTSSPCSVAKSIVVPSSVANSSTNGCSPAGDASGTVASLAVDAWPLPHAAATKPMMSAIARTRRKTRPDPEVRSTDCMPPTIGPDKSKMSKPRQFSRGAYPLFTSLEGGFS